MVQQPKVIFCLHFTTHQDLSAHEKKQPPVNGEVFAVLVSWDSVDRLWDVSGWELGEDGRWHAGYQVLCPSNAAL